ncbi:MAG TPA: methionine--tRNA ligase [Mollicutes bacterium]|nr:methionine--tRNA ligase [Mollicutes bacterium]
MNENFNIYTAIAYTSGKPHIGNTYEVVLADAIARYKRLLGYDVYFQTGTDEHGQKIAEKAFINNKNNQEFVDEVSLEVRRIWDVMNTSYDKFVRTTNSMHKEKVSKIFEKLYKQGDIYKGFYEGLYCTPCESFFTESQLNNGKCPDCSREVTSTKEEAYFFKLSNYAEQLEQHINNNPDFIKPESRKNEIVNNFIKPGLQDLCVSRTSFDWGVPVTFDEKHVIYVWIDALSNYITFIGYDPEGQHEPIFSNLWPADVHIIGKDILRFHVIYWPIMLMALDIPLPKQILGHPWLLSGEEKMSKSKGNIVYADDLVKLFDVDSVRHYMLSQMPYANDGIFTYELIIDKINADLVNNLGNLLNRTISMAYKYFDGIVPEPKSLEEVDNSLIDCVTNTRKAINNKMDEYKVSESINLVFDIFNRTNKYIDETMPWALAKDVDKRDRLATVIYNLLETIRIGAVLLQPFLPETSDKIFYQLNTLNKNYDSITGFDGMDVGIKLNQPEPLFLRIDKNKRLEEIENYYKNKR